MRSFLIVCLLVFSTAGVIASEIAISPAMNTEIKTIENYLRQSKENYKIDEVFPEVKLVETKDFPAAVRRSIYLNIWNVHNAPRLIDPADIRRFSRGVGIDISVSGKLIRSGEVDLGDEKAYVVIYRVNRGWSQNYAFLEYYFLDQNGELLESGTSN